MYSRKNAKTNDNEYCRHDRDSDDSDTTDDDHDNHDDKDLTAPYSILPSDEDREIIIDDALDELAVIARENILEFKREDFNSEEVIGTWIDSYVCQYFSEFAFPVRSNFSTATTAEAEALNEVLETYIQELHDEIAERFYEEIAPPRVSMPTDCDHDDDDVIDKETIRNKIRTLQEKPQPDQRTPEWYERRNNLITASAASKAFGSQASVNQLVYEKCKNQNHNCSPPTPLQGSVNSPLHWGQRYEPVTVMVYEHRNHTKLGEFGCIQHDKYPFIGASPDGINIDSESPIFGRMVEIKNIVNRRLLDNQKKNTGYKHRFRWKFAISMNAISLKPGLKNTNRRKNMMRMQPPHRDILPKVMKRALFYGFKPHQHLHNKVTFHRRSNSTNMHRLVQHLMNLISGRRKYSSSMNDWEVLGCVRFTGTWINIVVFSFAGTVFGSKKLFQYCNDYGKRLKRNVKLGMNIALPNERLPKQRMRCRRRRQRRR